MELREYLRILTRRIWLILPVTFIALVASLWFSYQQTPIYEASSTYVAKLGSALTDNVDDSYTLIYGLDTLAGRQRIFVTYCEVMTSRAVREEAYALMNVDPVEAGLQNYEVLCSNLVETNVLSIAVQGPSREVALRLNAAIGIVGSNRANRLYTSFPLELLDVPELADEPVSPQTTRNGVLGGILGLVIGVTAALLIEYLRSPLERMEAASIRNLQVGTYNERYFRQRFQQELNRPYAKLRPMSMALMHLTPNEEFELLPESVQNSLLRSAALTIQDILQARTDIIGYMHQWTFGILLTETSGEEARAILQQVHNQLRARPFEVGGYVATFSANTGIMSGSGDAMEYHEVLQVVSKALSAAEAAGDNTIRLITTTPKPFVLSQDNDTDQDRGSTNGSVFNISEADLFGDAQQIEQGWSSDLESTPADQAAAPPLEVPVIEEIQPAADADGASPSKDNGPRRHRLVKPNALIRDLQSSADPEFEVATDPDSDEDDQA